MNLGQTASNAEYISLKFELLTDVYLYTTTELGRQKILYNTVSGLESEILASK
jgi:hypothetical protein